MTLISKRAEALHLVRTLSTEERLVLVSIVRGASDKAIAASLSIPLEKVHRTKGSLMQKLGAKTTADAVRIGLYAEVEQPD